MFILLHLWNNIVMCKKTPLALPPAPPPFVKILISIVEKTNLNENYVEFYFRIGTVHVIF